MAINDRHVQGEGEVECHAAGDLAGLRLSAHTPWRNRVIKAESFCGRFQPDIVSLQFVSYGYSEKGFVWRLARHLRAVTGNLPLHIMFHELWIGSEESASWKSRLIGAVQRYNIRKLIATLRPKLVTTSTNVYVQMLKSVGVQSSILPLFGNIPVSTRSDVLESTLRVGDIDPFSIGARDNWLVGVLFGTIYPNWHPAELLDALVKKAAIMKKRLWLLGVGKLGHQGEVIWDHMAQQYGGKIKLTRFGQLPEEHVSMCLQMADFGIATTSWQRIGKSGAAAAMVDHGLPVIIPCDDWKLRGGLSDEQKVNPLLHRFSPSLLAHDRLCLQKFQPMPRLPHVAVELLEYLRECV